MKLSALSLPGLMLVEPTVFGDARGFFMETWHRDKFAAAGLDVPFVQDNHSMSRRGALRGMHYQITRPQGKLVRVVAGEIFDAVVDLRRDSPAFGRWEGTVLSAENKRQLWVPPGFAHGFYVMSESAEVVYKCTELYDPGAERALRWDDPEVGIEWPIPPGETPLLSAKDAVASRLAEAATFR